jgi:hypothetical protein
MLLYLELAMIDLTGKVILDMCCGSRMFWFNREDPRAVFVDNVEVKP